MKRLFRIQEKFYSEKLKKYEDNERLLIKAVQDMIEIYKQEFNRELKIDKCEVLKNCENTLKIVKNKQL